MSEQGLIEFADEPER
jgi:hypothetical protein